MRNNKKSGNIILYTVQAISFTIMFILRLIEIVSIDKESFLSWIITAFLGIAAVFYIIAVIVYYKRKKKEN